MCWRIFCPECKQEEGGRCPKTVKCCLYQRRSTCNKCFHTPFFKSTPIRSAKWKRATEHEKYANSIVDQWKDRLMCSVCDCVKYQKYITYHLRQSKTVVGDRGSYYVYNSEDPDYGDVLVGNPLDPAVKKMKEITEQKERFRYQLHYKDEQGSPRQQQYRAILAKLEKAGPEITLLVDIIARSIYAHLMCGFFLTEWKPHTYTAFRKQHLLRFINNHITSQEKECRDILKKHFHSIMELYRTLILEEEELILWHCWRCVSLEQKTRKYRAKGSLARKLEDKQYYHKKDQLASQEIILSSGLVNNMYFKKFHYNFCSYTCYLLSSASKKTS